jgi:type IV/VI secretion system ImpK/VasF family protein
MITELEKICNPVFQCVCNYWQLSMVTNMADGEKFRHDVTRLLEEAGKKALRDLQLEREFAWIEKPLVFFIDYMVKEGRFPFKENWRELARSYNELSGDEKFFDLLTETLNHPDRANCFAVFYIMLGLGFDGAYRFNHKYIEQYIRLCAERIVAGDMDIYSEPVLPQKKKKPFLKRRRKFTVRTALIAGAVFMAICFFINIISFIDTTKNYRKLLKQTAADSLQMIFNPPERSIR